MDAALNVLILEDNAADAELAVETLCEIGFTPRWQRVQTESDYLAALEPTLDLILADHSLPQYDSVRALQALQERELDVPFIVISGSIQEELAITLLKRGAADYILKDRRARLGQAVLQALEQKKLRQEKRQAEQSLVLFRTLLDRTNDAIEIIDPATGRYLDVNERACATHGYTRAEFLSLSVLDVEETLDHWPPPSTEAERAAGYMIVEGRHRRKDGSTFPVEVNVNFVQLDRDYIVAVVRDISERKRGEAQLRLHAAALEAAANGIVITDRQGDITWVNQAYTHMTGYAPADVLGQNPRLLKSGKHTPEFYRKLWNTILAGEVWRGEIINRRKDGSLYFDEMTITPVHATGDGITHFIAIKQDVTARKRTEESLRASEAKLNAISTSALDAIIMIDNEGKVIFWNRAAEGILGYSQAEILGQNFHHLLAPQRYLAEFEQGFARFRATGTGPVVGKVVTLAALHRDGHEFPIELSLGAMRLDDQWCGVGVLRDISARKRAEEALRLSEERFRNAFNFAGVSMGLTDLQGRFVEVNPACCQMLGYTRAELVGSSFQKITHPDDVNADLEQLKQLLAGEIDSYQIEKRNLHKEGRILWVLKTASLVRDQAGQPFQILAQVQDITARKHAEEQLRTLNVELERRVRERTGQLEATNKELEAFAYSVSHDLRAPLRGIDGFSQALLEDYHDKLDESGQDCLRRVRAATQRMGHLIDDILQLSRLSRSAMQREAVDLSVIASRVVAELQTLEPTRAIDIYLAPQLMATGDARLLEVVLMNLLGNAWKFTSKRADARIEFGVTGRGAFFVRDNGAGFDPAYADRLFTPFQRLHSTAEFPGTGIGLATVQRIIHRHAGEVWAESAVNEGATFYFTLGSPQETGRDDEPKNSYAGG